MNVSVSPESKEDADRVFSGLSDGGKVTMPMMDMFWGDYFGTCTDKFRHQLDGRCRTVPELILAIEIRPDEMR